MPSVRIVNDKLRFIFFLFFFSILFLILLFFILDLDKRYDVMLHVIIIQVTKHDKDMTSL